MISHIFSKLPVSYSEFITSQKTKGIQNTSVEDIKDGLEEYWKRKIKTSTKTTETEEKALSVTDGKPKGKSGGRFKGTCNYCGKPGHKAIDCFRRNRERTVKTETTIETTIMEAETTRTSSVFDARRRDISHTSVQTRIQ
jgi:hypothetical protein